MINEVSPINERIMRLRIRCSLGDVSLLSEYALTEASDLTMKDAFYSTLESVVDQISAPGKILFQFWGISVHRLKLIGLVMIHVLVPIGMEL